MVQKTVARGTMEAVRKNFTCFPRSNGMYLYLIMCIIWRFIVRMKSTIQ